MSNPSKIRPTLSAIYSIGMVLLLMIAPCKVRNFIQVALDTTQTEVSSKSQSKLTHSCISTNFIQGSKLLTKKSTHSISDPLSDNLIYFRDSVIKRLTYTLTSQSIDASASLPFYILYQNLLIYL